MRLPRLRWPGTLAVLAAAAIVVVASYAISAIGSDDAPAPTVAQQAAAAEPPGGGLTGGAVPLAPPPASAEPATPAASGDPSELDRLIGVFEDRIREREDATDMAFLGRLYLIRARRTSDLADYERARDVLEQARSVAPDYLDALSLLASARFSLHDFAGASELATRVVEEDPADLGTFAILGDAALAVGDVDAAAAAFETLAEALPGTPAVDVRLSQVAWHEGDAIRAVALAAAAEERAASSGVQAADLAWYRAYRADLAFDLGRYDVAATKYAEAQAAAPGWPVAVAGLAQIRAAEGEIDEAIELYLEALSVLPDPEISASLGDLYQLTGDEQAAAEQYAEVDAIALADPTGGAVYTRFLAEFYANHDRNVDQALRLTTADLELRQDMFGWDVHAWALYRNGRFEEAREASDRALATEPPEAGFWYHAGLISAALGDTDRAIGELTRALDLNPGFDPIHAREAQRALDGLAG